MWLPRKLSKYLPLYIPQCWALRNMLFFLIASHFCSRRSRRNIQRNNTNTAMFMIILMFDIFLITYICQYTSHSQNRQRLPKSTFARLRIHDDKCVLKRLDQKYHCITTLCYIIFYKLAITNRWNLISYICNCISNIKGCLCHKNVWNWISLDLLNTTIFDLTYQSCAGSIIGAQVLVLL